MTELRTAWLRAVHAGTEAEATTDTPSPRLASLLTFLGPVALASIWTCDAIEAIGPLAGVLCQVADAGPLPGTQLAALAAGITHTLAGVFEATRPGDDRPWLAVQVADGGEFVVATRSRALLDDLLRRFRVRA